VVASSPLAAQVRPQVLPDGTYATQAAVAEVPAAVSAAADPSQVTLRSLIVGGDTFLGAVVCVTLVKLLLRLAAPGSGAAAGSLQKRRAQCMLVMVSVLRLSEAGTAGALLGLDCDSHDRVVTCIRMLNNPSEDVARLWLTAYRAAYSASLDEQRTRAADEADAKAAENASQPDDPIDFAHLKHRRGVSQVRTRGH
jgi:coatomer subunit beta